MRLPNHSIMKKLFSICILVFVFSSSYAQLGGMRVYAGSTSLVNKEINANPAGFSHSGYHFGIDGRLMSGGMAFLVGGRFTSVSSSPTEDFKLYGHDSSLTMMNGRVGLDISIFSFTNTMRIRTKLLGSFDVVLSDPGTVQNFTLNDGWLGIVSGLGADIGPAIIDIEYEFGLINGYNMVKKSTFNSLTFSIGFFF